MWPLAANSAVWTAGGRPPGRLPTIRFSNVGKIGRPAGRPATGLWLSGWPPGQPGPFTESRGSLSVNRAVDRPLLCMFVHIRPPLGRPTSGSVDRPGRPAKGQSVNFQGFKLWLFTFNKIPYILINSTKISSLIHFDIQTCLIKNQNILQIFWTIFVI